MGRNSFDVLARLGWVRNACENVYNMSASIENTARGVPYVKVGNGNVRVVIFAKTRKVRIFYTPTRTGIQEHVDFNMGLHGNADFWLAGVTTFACGAATAERENT